LTVSLDGPENIHDRYRRNRAGAPTHRTAWRNLEALQKEHPDYYARMVRFSAVLAPPVDDEVIAGYFDSLGKVVIAADLDLYGITESWRSLPGERNIETHFHHFIDACVRRAAGEKIDINGSFALCYLGPALRRIQARANGVHRNPKRLGQCIVGARKIYVAPSGELYPCEKVEGGEDVAIGHVNEGVDAAKVDALMARFEHILERRCGSCWMRHLCTSCLLDAAHGGRIDMNKMDHRCEQRRHAEEKMLGFYAYLAAEMPAVLDTLKEVLPYGET
jgi:uncharacterized protein